MSYQTGIRGCRKCARLTRPKQTPADGRTVRRVGFGYCERCYLKLRREGKLAATREYQPTAYSDVRECIAGTLCDFCQDVAWLIEQGQTAQEIVDRYRRGARALYRRLLRHNKRYLAAYFTRLAEQERKTTRQRRLRTEAQKRRRRVQGQKNGRATA